MRNEIVDKLTARLAAHQRRPFVLEGSAPAAVLVPLVWRAPEFFLLFTERTHKVPSHQGQISFPGGKVDDGDDGVVAAALREAHEEVGLDASAVRVLGLLDDVPTPTGFVITPVIGLVDPAPPDYRPNEAEVAEAFEVSLADLARPGSERNGGEIDWRGQTYVMWEYHVMQKRIWGATARMVRQVLEHLGA